MYTFGVLLQKHYNVLTIPSVCPKGGAAGEIQERLTISGDYQGNITGSYDESTRGAFRKFCGRENLEERWFEDARIDRIVLEFIRQKLRE